MTKRPRTVLHGVDQTRPDFASLPSTGNMASECYIEDLKSKHVYDATAEAWLPMEYIPFRYDVAVDGGTVGAKSLSEKIPDDMIVFDGMIQVVQKFESGGLATLKITGEADADILGVTALATLVEGMLNVVPNGTAAKAIRTTAERTITATVAGATFTRGVLVGFLRCFRGFASEEVSSSSCSCSESSSCSCSESSSCSCSESCSS